ncbi:unnamed protein product [Discula destructiva]
MADSTGNQKTVVFFHPDLGIGGAERLAIDAAVGLQNRGYKVVIFTSYCDKGHCFEEARDGTLEVHVRGDTLIRSSYFSRFMILCAILRQAHLLLSIHWSGELARLAPDYFFVDQLSAGLPLLQYLFPRAPILFYCHYPDLLLVQDRRQWWKRFYRVPFDAFERWSMGFADAIAVNSKFTRGVVGQTWPSLARDRELKVVHPCIDVRPQKVETSNRVEWKEGEIILSINRFERKKDVALAIKAFAGLSKAQRKGVKLVIAGGYDSRVTENVGCHNELVALADSLHLTNATVRSIVTTVDVPRDTDVIFLLSVPNALKQLLLNKAKLLVYTPSNEHFGIVPIEAMLAGVPVLAANTGGPTETVLEGTTGWLRDPEQTTEWTAVMDRVLNTLTDAERAAMREAGVRRVRDNFADTQMAQRLHDIYAELPNPPVRGSWASWVSCVLAFVVTALVVSGGATVAALWALYLAKGGRGSDKI